MQPLISIILPIYKVEKFLPDCLQSIVSQTYKNTEIILVDDGSPDSCPAICEEAASKDSRIRVFHRENAGVAEARNFGLSVINGDYFCFVDSDDTVAADYIETLYHTITKNKADIACCSYLYKWADGREKCTMCTDKSADYVECSKGTDALEGILYGHSVYLPSCCMKLFKSDLKQFVYFPKYKIGEDFFASLEYYSKAEKVAFVNKPMYFYRQNDESVMHTTSIEKYYDMIISAEKIYEKAISIDPKLKKAAKHYLIEMSMIVLMKLQYEKNEKDKLAYVKQTIKRHRSSVIFDNKARPKIRISCIVSLLGFHTLCKIRNALTK